ncbi:MAG: PaaI family thioesterase [Brevundimonas sp.]|nr:MAG: PaaI family thioesterase [Brevundimonas sp.]
MTDLLDRLPYARFLGLTSEVADEFLIVTMPFADRLIGNPFPRKLHGGSTAAMLEFTAVAQVALSFPGLHLPRPINVTVAYLRPGKPIDVRAGARISRAGRRVAHVIAEAWQEDRAQPIASMTAHFLMANTES